jgi:hypothetical protein
MGDSHLNWTETFEEFVDQGWNDQTKLGLLLEFLDQNNDTVVNTCMFREHLVEVTGQDPA